MLEKLKNGSCKKLVDFKNKLTVLLTLLLSMLIFQASDYINKTVAIQPLGSFPDDLSVLMSKNINQFYKYQTLILRPISLPKGSYYAPRNRYRADSLIRYLKNIKPSKANYIIGLTEKDISHTNAKIPDYGIFGLAYCPGKSCVVSTFRYRNNVSNEVVEQRFTKYAFTNWAIIWAYHIVKLKIA